MILAIEKIISSLLTLPGIIIIINIIFFIYFLRVSWSKTIKILSGLLLIFLIITTTGLGVKLFVIPLEEYANEISEYKINKTENIPVVVLGGGINYNVNNDISELSSISRDRLIKGIMIVRKNKMPLIYSGGIGIGYEDTGESDIALNFVNQFGNINFIQENKARTTYENGLRIKEWLEENNYDKIYLVTSAIHIKRSIGVFKKLKIDYKPVVSNYSYSHQLSWLDYLPNRGSLTANMNALHEWIGLIWYKLNNRI